jgi:tetratricopeptide (TPR) repeat protein
MNKEEEAKKYFEKALQGISEDDDDEDSRLQSFAYYQGMAMQQLGQEQKAADLFEQLIVMGRRRLEQASEVDFFAKFGQGAPPHVRKAQAWYIQGLGYLGKGQQADAKDAFAKAVELDVNHIWANYYLSNEITKEPL